MRNPFRRRPFTPEPDAYARLRQMALDLDATDPARAAAIRRGIAQSEWLASLSDKELVAMIEVEHLA